MRECDREAASLYALGLLEEAESAAFEQHLSSCPACMAEVRESGNLAAQLAGGIPLAAPPAGLRDRVLSEAVLPRGVLALVRGGKMNWQPTSFTGVSIARLFEDPMRGEVTSLVRMSPGARYPSHHHAGLEHCYVVEGDLVFEDHTLLAGDYSAGSPDNNHTSATTTQGCLLFIVHNLRDQCTRAKPTSPPCARSPSRSPGSNNPAARYPARWAGSSYGPRRGVGLRIVHGDFDFQSSVIRPPELLGHFGGVGQRVSVRVQPQIVAETDGVYHQGVAFPLGCRVAVPGGVRIRREAAGHR